MPLCKNPYMAGNIPCPCNKCIPCLINRKRLWKHRILLESYCHENSAFITLTYSDDHLPFVNPKTNQKTNQATLAPSHLRNFLKRIRRASHDQRLRFYGVGEYGDQSWRPHYHLALFGYEPCWHGQTRKDKHSRGRPCCPPCDLIFEKWGFGGIDNAKIEPQSAGYIASYVTKKLTKETDDRLHGRYPEFSRKSNRPGLGALAIDKLADTIFSRHGIHALNEHGDVPVSLRHGSQSFPLGRYLRSKLRDAIGVDDATTEKSKTEYSQELLSLWSDHLKNPQIPQDQKLSLKHFIQTRDAQKILNLETKTNLHKKRKIL
ncbi:MAG: hypothetical protein KTR28_02230 [Micavibrio sp.]|nr:hypothetical protein [Micavibrio sp.]